ncbi:fad binding domain protein [Nannochloropsis oceanica]
MAPIECGNPRRVPICILGAGPQALALAAALLDSQPFSLDDDAALTANTRVRHLANQQGPVCKPADIMIVDQAGKWLNGWSQAFAFFEIPTLRSPMLAHPDPRTELALFEAACADYKECKRTICRSGEPSTDVDLTEWNAQILRKGKKTTASSSSNGNKKRSSKIKSICTNHIKPFLEDREFLYARPSTTAFARLCHGLVNRYNLGDKVVAASAISLTRAQDESNDVIIKLSDGQIMRAGRVICCMGPNGRPRIPEWALPYHGLKRIAVIERTEKEGQEPMEETKEVQENVESRNDIVQSMAKGNDGTTMPSVRKTPSSVVIPTILHSNELLGLGLKSPVSLYRGQHVLVVGGGLTSAHLVLSAHRHGAASVTLLTRRQVRVQEFCVDLAWVGRARHLLLSDYRGQPVEERVRTLRTARPGGSISPVIMKELRTLMERAGGKVVMYEEAEVTGILPLAFSSSSTCLPSSFCVTLSTGVVLPRVDRLLLATGSAVDVTKDPLLSPLLIPQVNDQIAEKMAIPTPTPTTCQGFPVVGPSLRLNLQGADKEMKVHVMGPYAALQVGPDAANLTGAMTASRLLADVIRAERREEEETEDGQVGKKKEATRNIHAFNNPFDVLCEDEDEDEDKEEEN